MLNPWRVKTGKLSNCGCAIYIYIYIYICTSVACMLSGPERRRNKLLGKEASFVQSQCFSLLFFFRAKFTHGRSNAYFSPTFSPRVTVSKWSCIFLLRSIFKEHCCAVRECIPFSIITGRLRKGVITSYYPRRSLDRGRRKEHNCKELKLRREE